MESAIFQLESRLSSAEKLALLSFLAQEFDLDQFLPLAGQNLKVVSEFVRQESARNKTKTDLIYCDLSGHSEFDEFTPQIFFELLSKKGIVCIDGLDSAEQLIYNFQDKFYLALQVPGFSILVRSDGPRAVSSIIYQVDLFRRKYFFANERNRHCLISGYLPLVTVIVLTYNHEQYISECLNSVLTQQGNFRMRVIIIDDASSDQTPQVVRKTIDGWCNDNLEIEFHVNSHNCGVVKNLSSAIHLAVGCDYFTFCEGDDFWSSEFRIEKHLELLTTHPEWVMTFNTIEMCSADGSLRRIHEVKNNHEKKAMDGSSLAAENFIGNFTACFYDGCLIGILPEKLFDIYTVDWMFNLYCSQFGEIGYLQEPLSVYRQHDAGEWSSRQTSYKYFKLLNLIDIYNVFLDFQYDEGIYKYKKLLLDQISDCYLNNFEKFDLLIFDDVFPAPRSGFRFEEFTAYLKEFPNSMVLTSGVSLHVLGDESLRSLIRKFQRRYPELGSRVVESDGTFPVQLGKLIYVNFFTNAYALLPIAELARVPFAFTLYPGGGFVLNNAECDRKLKRIFDSPCFLKVIVTQQITYDYLINKGLCHAGKIELIFGVVMPQEPFVAPIQKDKMRWGFGKNRLDICFMAHRYTPQGEDKGYDVFINTACRLRSMHDDIYFHVVGPYDRRVIDIGPIGDHIEFHGTLNPEQFNDFFMEMDIVMSPNISGKIWPGSFDGFPTASCTEGALRGTAIFCTDEFNSAEGRFVDGQDFVLVRYDLDHIVNKVESYYRKPEELKAVGERGSRRVLDLYSYQSQMAPRVRILRELIDSPFVFDVEKWRGLKPCSTASATSPLNVIPSPIASPIWVWLKKHSPESMKIFYRKFIKRHFRPTHAW